MNEIKQLPRVSEDMVAMMALIQKEARLTDGAFGKIFGVTREYWNAIRCRRRTLSRELAERAKDEYPQLYPLFLSEYVTKVK